ncbi:MAG: UDP-2,3-diacylglucosamine diphosphatase [Acidiferrobacteraceae bacterium]|jgi:UDP-2,3-diacylglucosamine hydrolase
MATLFVSDLHLCAERPAVTALFLKFLEGEARDAEALYILGDLFEFWIGDDARDQPDMAPIVHALRAYSDLGIPLFAMHGNRDFLMREGFEEATGAKLLPDPTVIDLYGQATLITHGDYLCTDDVEYQEFRRMVRDPEVQKRFLASSMEERRALVRTYRDASRESTSAKPLEIMDVNPDAVRDAMRKHEVRRLIHGHTHRPAIHDLDLDGQQAQRIVLGDWYDQGSVLVCTPDSCELRGLQMDAVRANRSA